MELAPLASLGVTSTAEIYLQIFNDHTKVWDHPVPHLCPF